jgi:ABC-type uncharacterized transport system involved in gliding motility auxiliary subunit
MNWIKKLQQVNIVQSLGLNRYKMQAIIMGAIALFVLTNILLVPVSLRADLSKGHVYTLTDSSKKIINDLDKDITITLYASSGVPPQIQAIKREVTDLLQEYDRVSGKVNVYVKDPQTDTKAQAEATNAGLPQLPFRVYQQNKVEAIQGYFGMVITYDQGQELIPQATDISGLEYSITSAIYKLTRKELPQIALVGVEQPIIPQQDILATFKQIATKQFNFVYTNQVQPMSQDENGVDISPTPAPFKLSDSYKTAIIFDTNQKEYSAQEIQEIRRYIQNKGNVIFLASGVWVTDQLSSQPAKHNLTGLLKEFGIDLKQNLVLSQSSELINYGNQVMSIYVPYPLWVKTSEFDASSSLFTNVTQLVYLWTSGIDLRNANGYEAKSLVKSSTQSWNMSSNFVLDPQKIPQPQSDEIKQSTITAEAMKKDAGRVMLISSNRFLEDRYLSQSSNNLEFIMNVLSEYASGGALSGIPQRAVNLYPLPELNEPGKEVFRYLNILLLPGIFGLYGAVRLMRRHRARS